MKVYDFKDLRPKPNYPVYPPYHTGNYLEDFIFEYYKENRDIFDKSGRIMIPVSWTTLYVDNVNINVQEYLDALPKGRYWTVSQHDDGIRQQLPPDTLHFAAGGRGGGIPILLVCSPIPKERIGEIPSISSRQFLCSFVGSTTHPIRQLYRNLYGTPEAQFHGMICNTDKWSQSVSDDKLINFINITKNSKFAFAPRGYGLSSFRLYEIMQMDTIPIYCSDIEWLPWTDELNWNEFSVIISPNDLPNLYKKLIEISPAQMQRMIDRKNEIYDDYFTMEGIVKQISKRL